MIYAHFFGKNLAELPRLFFVPLFYLGIFSACTSTSSHPGHEYVLLLLVVWAVSGFGYLVSLLVSPNNSQLAGVLVVLSAAMCNGIFVPVSRMGRVASVFHLPWVSYAYHMAGLDEGVPALSLPNLVYM